MGKIADTVLLGMRLGWQAIDIVKPVRTIDELTQLVIDIWNRRNPPGADSAQEVQSHLAALRAARQAVAKSGGDRAALSMIDERIAVLGALGSVPPAADQLSGSISTQPAGGPAFGPVSPGLVPVGEHRPPGIDTLVTLLSAPAQLLAPTDDQEHAAAARARLQGQLEALRLVNGALSDRTPATQMPADSVATAVDNRLAALHSVAAMLSRPRGAGRPVARPAVPPAEPVVRHGRQSIDISTGQDRRS